MKVTVVGCGDAFGSGGRLQTCYHVASAGREVLLDCGAPRSSVCSGSASIPTGSRRSSSRICTAITSPASSGSCCTPTTFPAAGAPHRYEAGGHRATVRGGGRGALPRHDDPSSAVSSSPSSSTARTPRRRSAHRDAVRGAPPLGCAAQPLRLEAGGKVLGFSGDTEWVESLVPAARDAGLFIAECYGFAREVRWHMNWRVIESNLDRLGARRVMLTHMNADMLANAAAVRDPRYARRGRHEHRGGIVALDEHELDRLLAEIRACRACVDAPRGRLAAARAAARAARQPKRAARRLRAGARHARARLGPAVQRPSGVRLRDWMGVSEAEFYDTRRIAVIPMGFCFPGLDAKGGDLPPRPECAPLWRARLLALLPRLELLLLVGGYTQRWHLPGAAAAGLTSTVADWQAILARPDRPRCLPLPHPPGATTPGSRPTRGSRAISCRSCARRCTR